MRKLTEQEKVEAKKKFDEYNLQWKKDNYEQIAIRLPQGYRKKLNTIAERQGVSATSLIKTYIDENWVE